MNYNISEFKSFKSLTKLILITPHGRSGSLFVQGLLDSHPQILSLPYFINHYDIDFKYRNLEELIDRYFELNKEILQVSDIFELDIEKNKIFDVKFIKKIMHAVLSESKSINNKDILCSLFYAYLKFSKKDILDIKFLLVHLHLYDACFNTFSFEYKIDLKHHKCIMNDFDSKLYIALTSDSTLSISSYIRKNVSLQNLSYHISYIIFSYLSLNKMKELYPCETFVLDIDKLNKSKGNEIIKILAEYGVKYDKSFLSVTLGGIPLDLRPKSISLVHKFDTVSFDRKIRRVFELKFFSKKYQYLSLANKIFNNKTVLYQAPFKMKINKTLLIFYIRYEILHEVIKSIFKKNGLKYYLFLDRCYKSLFSMFR